MLQHEIICCGGLVLVLALALVIAVASRFVALVNVITCDVLSKPLVCPWFVPGCPWCVPGCPWLSNHDNRDNQDKC